jgi:hypothetical protein
MLQFDAISYGRKIETAGSMGSIRVITIKKRREMAGKFWMSPVRLVVELRLRYGD